MLSEFQRGGARLNIKLIRQLIDRQSPYSLSKAGTYATELNAALKALDIHPTYITGGNGPDIANMKDVEVMMIRGLS